MKTKKSLSIAVIIPVYNVENWIRECLDSITQQPYPFDEIILIDDGSTDMSREICEEYERKFKNIELYVRDNHGAGAARNYGLDLVHSDYLVFLDADDYLEKNAVQILLDELIRDEYDVLCYEARAFGDDRYLKNWRPYNRDIKLDERVPYEGMSFFENVFPDGYFETVCMAVYKTDFIRSKKITFPEGIMYEDNYFIFRSTVQAEKIGYIHHILYNRRLHTGSVMTGSKAEKKREDFLDVTKKIFDFALKEYDIDANYALIRYLIYRYWILYRNSEAMENEQNKQEYIKKAFSDFLAFLQTCGECERAWNVLELFKCWRILQTVSCVYEKSQGYEYILSSFSSKLKEAYKELLHGLFLNGEKVLIYGCGKHTEGMLGLYELLEGNISAELSFAISEDSTEEYRGKIIHNIKECILRDYEYVIVSSYVHRKEMIETINEIDKNVKIIEFYEDNKGDIFSPFADSKLINELAATDWSIMRE